MELRPDEKLASYAANLWRPIESEPDPNFRPALISQQGVVELNAPPPAGPETDEERFHAVIAQAARPSRWFRGEDLGKPQVFITKKRKLLGPVGYGFRFVASEEDADGVSRFPVPWEVV